MSADAAAYREFKQRGGIADLSDRTKLRLDGADRVRFLNGQVTADVRKLGEGQVLPACVTTAKGKLCGEVMIRVKDDTLLIDAEASLRESLLARLDRYIVADDVQIHDVTDLHGMIHITGRAFEQGIIGGVPLGVPNVNRFGAPGLDGLLPPQPVFAEVWAKFAGELVVLDEPLRELLRIEAGIPRWGYELGEDTLPPEAGLDRTHIDYHKGCYIGQEVISRIKSVGHVNRELSGFISTTGAPLAAGALLFAAGSSDRPIGTLTSAAFSFALEKPIALGYLRRGSPTRDLIARTADSTGAEVVVDVHPLPFVP